MPQTRREFWEAKLARNVVRDRANSRALRRLGWHVITVWECELQDEAKVARRLAHLLGGMERNSEADHA
jgi:DNA mismatch endonuclease (patch repair protein)